MASNLELLRALTERLTLGNLMAEGGVVISGDGRAFPLVGLLKDDKVAVLRTKMDPGMTVESHNHPDSIEILVVVGGALMVGLGSNNHSLTIGDSITLHPGDVHRAYTTGGADLICITVPPANEYPDVTDKQ